MFIINVIVYSYIVVQLECTKPGAILYYRSLQFSDRRQVIIRCDLGQRGRFSCRLGLLYTSWLSPNNADNILVADIGVSLVRNLLNIVHMFYVTMLYIYA